MSLGERWGSYCCWRGTCSAHTVDGKYIHFAPRYGFNHGFKVVQDFVHPQCYIMNLILLIIMRAFPSKRDDSPLNPGTPPYGLFTSWA